MNEELAKWVDDEKRLDRKVRRISYVAWIVTLAAVIVYGVRIIVETALRVHAEALMGGVQNTTEVVGYVLQQLTPFILVLGVLALLVAILGTIGMLVRFRTASLADIQARLAAMEGMLTNDQRAP